MYNMNPFPDNFLDYSYTWYIFYFVSLKRDHPQSAFQVTSKHALSLNGGHSARPDESG